MKNTENQATEIINEIIKSNITEHEKTILKVLLKSLLKDSLELNEIKENSLHKQLEEQKNITLQWIEKYQILQNELNYFHIKYQKIKKDPYLTARGERLKY